MRASRERADSSPERAPPNDRHSLRPDTRQRARIDERSATMRLAALTVLVSLLLFASSAGATRSGATLTVSPNAAPAWSWATGSGCGYAVGSEVYVDIQKPEALAFLSVMPGATGCISFRFTTDGPGTYL